MFCENRCEGKPTEAPEKRRDREESLQSTTDSESRQKITTKERKLNER